MAENEEVKTVTSEPAADVKPEVSTGSGTGSWQTGVSAADVKPEVSTGSGTGSWQTGVSAPKKKPPAQSQRPVARGQRGGNIVIPQKAFKERIEREAASIVRQRLGVSLEEAEKIVRAGASSTAETGAQAADQAVAEMRRENERLAKKLQAEKEAAQQWERKHKKDTTRLNDRLVEKELHFKASRAGIQDTDYALHLYARAANSGEADDPDKFFASLRAKVPMIFDPATAPKPEPVAPSTAPAESTAPGGVTPKPAEPGLKKPAEDVADMSPQDFAARTRNRYGWSVGG
jgi:hypothetical protein